MFFLRSTAEAKMKGDLTAANISVSGISFSLRVFGSSLTPAHLVLISTVSNFFTCHS